MIFLQNLQWCCYIFYYYQIILQAEIWKLKQGFPLQSFTRSHSKQTSQCVTGTNEETHSGANSRCRLAFGVPRWAGVLAHHLIGPAARRCARRRRWGMELSSCFHPLYMGLQGGWAQRRKHGHQLVDKNDNLPQRRTKSQSLRRDCS